MYIEKVKYTDYNGKEKERLLYFNYNRIDMVRHDAMHPEGFQNYLKNISENGSDYEIFEALEELILDAYGVRTEDGRFLKSKMETDIFKNSEEYAEFLLSMINDKKKILDFAKGVFPGGEKVDINAIPELKKYLDEAPTEEDA